MRLPLRPPARPAPDGHVRAGIAGGGIVDLRPLRAGETAPLDVVFAGLSPQSRLRRYLVSMPRLPQTFRRSLVHLDGHDRVAWLAVVDGRPAGIGRYVRTAPDCADLAFEVVDAHQGRGVGSALLDAVVTVASARGVARVEALVEPGNRASVALAARLGIRLVHDQGLLAGRGRLRLPSPPRVDRSAVLALAARTRCGEEESVGLLTS